MDNKQSMNLISPSGYAMPFELGESTPLEITLGYGQQVNPYTGVEFFHHGVDFKVRPGTWLKALATGVVSGIASEMQKGFHITVNYKNYADGEHSSYEVIYSHIKESLCTFGKNVKAGDNIAVCDSLLHIEVRFNGKEINPLNFLAMLRDNLLMDSQAQMSGNNPEIGTLGMEVHTPYDAHEKEIDSLYSKFFGSYMVDTLLGRYVVPKETESRIRDAFETGRNDGVFFENTPSNMNPGGLGMRSIAMQSIMQTLLIGDFLNYLAFKHSIFLSSMSELEKKKLLTGH